MQQSTRPAVLAAALMLGACAQVDTGAGTPDDATAPPSQGAAASSMTDPRPGTRVGDFVARVIYRDDDGGAFGVRWEHAEHGMPVTTLRIPSVPQVFLHVNTPPVSDRGEPHTGEHLLLAKGARGKMLAASGAMSLVGDTAWTSQTDVVYAWNCAAGERSFLESVDRYLESLLLPDYTDEEIRREVMNLGVKRDEATGRLTLEEKGTIYNEMVSSYEKRWVAWNEHERRLAGPDHPLSWSSGGEPAAVRTMEPHHIHEFHRDHYHLGRNMGMLVALPDAIPAERLLVHLSDTMAHLDATPELAARPKTVHAIPAPRPESDRSLHVVPYPNTNEDDIGVAVMAWPPVPAGTPRNILLGQTLMSTLGGDASSTLYARLMDGGTREVEVGASDLGTWLETGRGLEHTAMLYFDGLPRTGATPAVMDAVRGVVADEIARVRRLPDQSPELARFNERALLQLGEWERGIRKQVSSPPLFGHRGAGGFWFDHLRLVDRLGGTERSVTLAPVAAALRAELATGKNPWGPIIDWLHLDEDPWVTVSVPSRAELERRQAARRERLDAAERELMRRYGVDDGQAAIARYLEEVEAATAELAARDRALPQPRLVDDVPLTHDPTLVLEPVAWGVDGFRGVFDGMTFVETAVALDLRAWPQDALHWLPLVPALLTQAGCVLDDGPLPYDETLRRRSREIHGLSAEASVDAARGRYELLLRASGDGPVEGTRAVDWIETALRRPWLAPENLPRLRDLVAEAIRGRRTVLGGREERWVRNPAGAVRFQDDPLHLATTSHHAALFLLARCEWQLTDPPTGAASDALARFLEDLPSLAGATPEATAAAIGAHLAALPDGGAGVETHLRPIGHRLQELIGDSAPAVIERDLRDLARVAAADVAVDPASALTGLAAHVDGLAERALARFVVTGSRATTAALRPRIEALFGAFHGRRVGVAAPDRTPLLDTRLRHHQPDGPAPVHYGLVHRAGTSGVFTFSADETGLDDLSSDALLDPLAVAVFGGSGAHGLFMQTISAGLAYSNGTNAFPPAKRLSYYAERCPDLVETMKFVTGLVEGRETLGDTDLTEYAVAGLVRYHRMSDGFEDRARTQAEEIVEGLDPADITAFRRAVLALREEPGLWRRIRERIPASLGRVLVGAGPRSRDVEGGTFLVIAPERLIAGWEQWVRDREGADERVYRLYGRDFWMVD